MQRLAAVAVVAVSLLPEPVAFGFGLLQSDTKAFELESEPLLGSRQLLDEGVVVTLQIRVLIDVVLMELLQLAHQLVERAGQSRHRVRVILLLEQLAQLAAHSDVRVGFLAEGCPPHRPSVENVHLKSSLVIM